MVFRQFVGDNCGVGDALRRPAASLADAPADRQPGGCRLAAGRRGAAAVGRAGAGGRCLAVRPTTVRRVGRRRRPLLHRLHPFALRNFRR